MRIGIVKGPLFERYGPWWSRLLRDAGADLVEPDPAVLARAHDDPRILVASSEVFRDVAAQAIALSGCDAVLIPSLNPGYEGRKGSASDPFVADLPATLARAVPGLPPIWGVPADLDDRSLEETAMRHLLSLTASPATVRRLWQRHRADAKAHRPAARSSGRPSTEGSIAWVGQPWNVTDARLSSCPAASTTGPSSHRIAPAELREEGWRLDPDLAPTDAEAIGAVRRFARRGSVEEIRVLVDPTSSADAWLLRRAQALAGPKVVAWDVARAEPLDVDLGASVRSEGRRTDGAAG